MSPRGAGTFLHDDIIEHLKRMGLFQKTCDIEELVSFRNSVGEEDGEYLPIHEDVKCQVGVPRLGMMGKEMNQTSSRVYESEKGIFLEDYFPELTVDKHQIVIDGEPYNIEELGHSVNERFTWIIANRIK